MTRKNVLLALLFALFVSLPVLAQDATSEPTQAPVATAEPTAAATQEATNTEAEEQPVVPANLAGTVLLILIPILSIAFGGGGVLAMVLAWRKDKAAVQASEELAKSVPQPVATGLLNTIDGLVAILGAGREVLDGIPAASKTSLLSDVSTAELRAELDRREHVAG